MKKQKYNYKAVYTGRRLGIDGKMRQRFEKPDGEEMFFRGVKGVWIGHTYRCGKENIQTKPERTEDDRIDNPEWEALDALVDEYNGRKRAEAKVRKLTTPAIKTAVEALKPLLRKRNYFERKALIELLAERAKSEE